MLGAVAALGFAVACPAPEQPPAVVVPATAPSAAAPPLASAAIPGRDAGACIPPGSPRVIVVTRPGGSCWEPMIKCFDGTDSVPPHRCAAGMSCDYTGSVPDGAGRCRRDAPPKP